MARPLPLRIKPNFRTLTPFRHFSSSSPPSANQTPNLDQTANQDQNTVHQSSHSYSSLFSDIKQRLRSPQPPPRRIPNDPPPPLNSPDRPPVASLDEIRKRLAEFRSQNPNPNLTQDRPVSFQELFKNNNAAVPNSKPERFSFGSIRESLVRSRSMGVKDPQKFQSQFSFKPSNMGAASLIGDQESLPQSIFGREMREKTGEKDGGWDGETKELKTEFVKMYSPEELGEKLRRLRPSDAEKGGKDWSLLEEMNVRLAKLRELEVKETESRMGGVMYSDLRKSLLHLANKKPNAVQRMSILSNIGLQTTPSFMLKPPQEQLLENYFHPDHMSSAEKMKLELKKVRDEFKMSESDFGSTRVQVAQLTTKIKHLSSVLHKKDKHSRKGLNEMVQRRKKLLKYLRRTDWDSYCFVLSKLGLRDVPEYKVPDYKC